MAREFTVESDSAVLARFVLPRPPACKLFSSVVRFAPPCSFLLLFPSILSESFEIDAIRDDDRRVSFFSTTAVIALDVTAFLFDPTAVLFVFDIPDVLDNADLVDLVFLSFPSPAFAFRFETSPCEM